jgi:predicted dehydrogenase
VRLGLVGCGRLVEAGYIPALAGRDDVIVSAVADPRPDRLELVARLAGSEPVQLADAAALAASGVVDAALVATPAEFHVADAAVLAVAGIPSLVEKPPAPNLRGAEALALLEPAPWIGFNRRFTHGAKLIDAVPPEGPIELDLELNYRRASWGSVSVGDPVALDLVPHLVDLTLLLSSSPEAGVRAATLSHERAEIELETGRGAARIRCASDRPHRERIAVRARGRRVGTSADGGMLGLIASRLPGREHPLVASLRAQVGAFVDAVRGRDGGLLATAQSGVQTMRVVDAARELAS